MNREIERGVGVNACVREKEREKKAVCKMSKLERVRE